MKGSLKEIMLARHPKEVTRERFVIEMNMPTEYPPIKARHTMEGGVRDRFFASVAELPSEVTVIHPFNVHAFKASNERTFYVAPDGCDSAEGTKDAPLASLKEALVRLAGKMGGKIVLRGGNYNLDETVCITAEHSGTEESPLIITAEEGEVPMLSASRAIPASAFATVTDEAVLVRLPESVRGKVVEVDLKALGVTDFGTVRGAKLLVNNIEQSLARYPNVGEDLIPVTDVLVPGWSYETNSVCGDWEIVVDDDRCYRWQKDDDIHIYGALCWEWTRLYARLQEINAEKRSIKGYGRFDIHPVQKENNNTYFFCNVLEELDTPGEWYLDRKTGKLYVYPPEETFGANDDIRFITGKLDIIRADGAENVIFDRINVGRCCGNALKILNCRQFLIQRCHITGVCGDCESDIEAFCVEGGYRSGIIDSVIEHFSVRAGSVSGGDRKKYIPANNFIQNCKVINPHCRFGISSNGGVGNIVSHNYSHNTTMGDGGNNEGIMEYNIVEGGDTETHDTGMIYVAGGGCSTCGNHFRYNYFFDFAMGDYGVYFDDLSRGMYAYGNIVVGNGTTEDGFNWHGGGRSFNHHNGGEHCYWNNISIDAGYFAFGGDISYWIRPEDHWKGFFNGIYETAMNMGTEPYFKRNPTYRDYVDNVKKHHEDRQDPDYKEFDGMAEKYLRMPWCNHYENNLIIRANRPYKFDNGIETATGLETNYITDEDPGFVDLENRDYRFKADAEVFDKIPGFIAPPFERMGIVEE